MTMKTPTKTSLENITNLFHLCFFAIVSTSSEMGGELLRNQIGRSGVQVKKKMKTSPLCVLVLHKTLNLVISCCCFTEDGKEMHQLY